MVPALSVNHIGKTFKLQTGAAFEALKDVSLEINAGTIHGLLGPNGAGKSTLINLISGVLAPDSGSILIEGADVMKESERSKQMIGIVPQEVVMEMAFTVREVLWFFAGMYGVPASERGPRIEAALKDLDLFEKADERARSLSGGMKRRLMIAKAIMHKPKLLILDEPTAGVDVALRQKIWELVRRLNKEGTTILFTTHYLEEAEQLCENVTLINHGRIIKGGSVKELLRESSRNMISFELFKRDVEHLPGAIVEGTEYRYPMKDLEADVHALTNFYGGNLKSIRTEAVSLEQVFLEVTKG
jgi:ABC-2 type transport system ATP-binding protein